MDIKK